VCSVASTPQDAVVETANQTVQRNKRSCSFTFVPFRIACPHLTAHGEGADGVEG
jgi:hypothetical protein